MSTASKLIKESEKLIYSKKVTFVSLYWLLYDLI
jgi:hypothetical protein